MKKLMLVLALAVACFALLAAPAFAAPQLQDGVYVWIYGDLGWMQWQNPDGWVAFGEPQDSIPLWSRPYPSDALAPGGAFNPHIGAKGWLAVWLYPVAPGTYEVTGTETFTRSFVDLGFGAENRPGPAIIPAGTWSFDPWTLVVPN
jgi:hypothetical protein